MLRLFAIKITFLALLGEAAFACARVEKINIFVAASLIEIVQILADDLQVKSNCIDINIVAGSSAILSRQIIAGAPADIFISADIYNANLVAQNKQTSYEKLFGNKLVIVGQNDFSGEINLQSLPENIAKNERLAIGDPEHVPMGIYAREALQSANVWQLLKDRLAPSSDARGAASFVRTGATRFGIVYFSDALAFELNIVGEIDKGSYSEIGYYGIIINEDNNIAMGLLNYFDSEIAKQLLISKGFLVDG
ncbi:MAG: molybdate ABC transporter substrate-binding protein [Devosiaceae bacterium]|nr:molybdate ABC transporter substrate-binding protein [Devosiaceae bacterium]